MRTIVATMVIMLFLCPYFARADTAQIQPSLVVSQVPDIKGWNIISVSRIELIISNHDTAYLGLETEYNNPNDSKEFVKVILRHIPLIVSRRKETNGRLLREAALNLYLQKEESDLLRGVSVESDPILYVKWRMMENPLTDRLDMLDGDVDIWFMPANGKWLFIKNEHISVEFLTENVGNGKLHNVFSGMKFQVGDQFDRPYHIIRVDRSILESLVAKEK